LKLAGELLLNTSKLKLSIY